MMDLNFDKDQLPTERALGLHWCTESDNFTFNVQPKSHQKRNITNIYEEVPQRTRKQWTKWTDGLNLLSEFKVQRCFKNKGFGKVMHAQLHNFADASDQGYGTVSYMRLVNTNNNVHVTFVMGKGRVAPIKGITIPRLELAAAVLAVKVDKLLKSSLQLQLDHSMF